jgi:hypothetical protein
MFVEPSDYCLTGAAESAALVAEEDSKIDGRNFFPFLTSSVKAKQKTVKTIKLPKKVFDEPATMMNLICRGLLSVAMSKGGFTERLDLGPGITLRQLGPSHRVIQVDVLSTVP